MISIQIKSVSKAFGTVKALDAVSLEVNPGEMFFLLGPSGCGKTTLLRSLAGFYSPDQGEIYFDRENVTGKPPHKRNTAMMFQSYALWPHMTVKENVAFGLEERHMDKHAIKGLVAEILDSVKMGEFAERLPSELSGGQQQRVALARALVIKPKCLLLDEPLSNLDAQLRTEMRAEIRRVCKEYKLTTVYVTHDQKEALSIADRLAVMESGKVLQVGTPKEMYRRPINSNVARFIGDSNFITGKLVELKSSSAVVETTIGLFEGVIPDALKLSTGSTVVVSIRPESWSINSVATQGLNQVKGTLGQTLYLGELAQHEFFVAETKLKLFEFNPKVLQPLEGSVLNASVEVEDVVILAN
jgi:iron(III) transport system ATP-binding protein